jgi:hypothetical protein
MDCAKVCPLLCQKEVSRFLFPTFSDSPIRLWHTSVFIRCISTRTSGLPNLDTGLGDQSNRIGCRVALNVPLDCTERQACSAPVSTICLPIFVGGTALAGQFLHIAE